MAEKTPQQAVKEINEKNAGSGLPQLAVVDPRELKGRDVNARYLEKKMYQQLVDNVRRDGTLESVPLCVKKGDVFEIISGHHRVQAAVDAGLETVLVIYREGMTEDEIISKQLSHNAIEGKDDPVILKQLYDSIQQIEWKMYSGVSAELEGFKPVELSFPSLQMKQLVLLFVPEKIGAIDEAVESLSMLPSDTVRVSDIESHGKVIDALKRIKKVKDIKSTNTAFGVMVSLAMERLDEIQREND